MRKCLNEPAVIPKVYSNEDSRKEGVKIIENEMPDSPLDESGCVKVKGPLYADKIRVEDIREFLPNETPQDRGEPSPVPYSLIVQRPSPDLPQSGEQIYFRGAFKDTSNLTAYLQGLFADSKMMAFIENAFNYKGIYRLEIVLADWSIKIYKHPNNP